MKDIKKCPKCGKELHQDAQYCMYCMHSLQPKKDVTPVGLQSRGRHMLYALPVVIAGAVLLSIIGLLFLKDNGGESKSPQLSGQTETTFHDSSNLSDTAAAVPSQPPIIPETTHSDKDIETETTPPKPSTTDQEERKPTIDASTAPETEPQPSAPLESVPLCSHYFLEATCIAPMTCVHCGDTMGEIDPNAHIWNADTVTVHHKEVGHYEEQTDYVKKTKYLCFFCGYNQAGFDSMEEVLDHTLVHRGSSGYDAALPFLESLIETREVWEEVTEQVWVVDEEAYDETVVTGYTCSVCKCKKDE